MPNTRFDLRAATAADADAIAGLLADLEHPTPAEAIPARLAAIVNEGGAVVVAIDARDQLLGLIRRVRVRMGRA